MTKDIKPKGYVHTHHVREIEIEWVGEKHTINLCNWVRLWRLIHEGDVIKIIKINDGN